MECCPLVEEIKEVVNDWLSKPTAQMESRRNYIQSLFPKMKYSDQVPEQMLKFFLEKPLSSNELYADLNNFYYWLFTVDSAFLKESSDGFWNRVLDYFHNFPSLISSDKLIWINLKYVIFIYSHFIYLVIYFDVVCKTMS